MTPQRTLHGGHTNGGRIRGHRSRAVVNPTEADAYRFIKDTLRDIGWDTRNPERNPEGQVYTQNECLNHPEIRAQLGRNQPESIVKVNESIFWVIEAKRNRNQLAQAVREAQEYAENINRSTIIKAKFISGVAGNDDDSYLVSTMFFNDREFVPVTINSIEISGFLSPSQTLTIVQTGNPNIADIQIDDKLFMAKAEEINEILHLGAVNPHKRASVMAAVLLSMLDTTQPNIEAPPSVLINEINARVQRTLRQEGKPEFYDYIKLELPTTEDNHIKYKTAIVSTIQQLNILNIRSAMNSGTDVLGKFYEVFLKYASWAQDLGIVLTPRHVTQFAAQVTNVNWHDIIYDPCCGTGGFLVAAFDYVKRTSPPDQIENFKRTALFGIEQDAGVASLAIVNMIFRGDGKNNIIEGNCFTKYLGPSTLDGFNTAVFNSIASNNPPITKVLMNPPFALKRGAEKEFKFINYALKQMENGGILFSILPYSCMVKPGAFKHWRNELLHDNTLLSVITFPQDLFYPVGVYTVGIIIKKGIPHLRDQNVLWISALNDGLMKSKGKRLPSSRAVNDLERVKDLVRGFVISPGIAVNNIEKFQKAAPLDFEDQFFEAVPEAYLDQSHISLIDIRNEIDTIIRESIAFLIKNMKGDSSLLVDDMEDDPLNEQITLDDIIAENPHVEMRKFLLSNIISIRSGSYHNASELDDGAIPLISCGETDNGLVKYIDAPDDDEPYKNTITIAYNGQPLVTKFHPYQFYAKDDVAVCTDTETSIPKLLFVAANLNLNVWRYSYGRKCFREKVKTVEVYLPVTQDGEINDSIIAQTVATCPYWKYLERLL